MNRPSQSMALSSAGRMVSRVRAIRSGHRSVPLQLALVKTELEAAQVRLQRMNRRIEARFGPDAELPSRVLAGRARRMMAVRYLTLIHDALASSRSRWEPPLIIR